MDKKSFILIFLFVLSGLLYYLWTEPKIDILEVRITRVIDGDTVETDSLGKIRLIGINTPESNEIYYLEAKNFLEGNLLNKTVKFYNVEKDKYNRSLGYLFLGEANLNEEILGEGLGYLYYYERDKFYESLRKAEENAREKELGLWKISEDSSCLELINLKYVEEGERCTNGEILEIKNNCNKDFLVTIKDDATHIFKEEIKANSIFKKNFSCIFNDAGDSLYIREDKGLLIFYRY